MSPKLILLRTINEINDLIKCLSDKEFIAIDTETTGLSNSSQIIGMSFCCLDREAYYVILKEWDGTSLKSTEIDGHPCITELLISLIPKNLIMHNAVFDCQMVESNFNIRLIDSLHTDTMVLAHLINENRRVALKELARELLGEKATVEQDEMKASVVKNGGKYTASDKEMYKADSALLGKYGAKDAWLTYRIFMKLLDQLDDNLYKFFYEDESMPLLKGPTYDMNVTGLYVDSTALLTLKKTLEAECEEAKAFIHSEIHSKIKDKYPGNNKKTTFNIESNQQLSWLLFDQYGLEFGTLTDEGKKVCRGLGLRLPYTLTAKRDFIEICKSNIGMLYEPEAIVNGKIKKGKAVKEPWGYIAADKKTLSKLSSKYKWIEKLLKYKKKRKLLDTYVSGIEERIEYGIIRPSFLQTGTTSGRYSSRNPNFQNLPRDDKRIKSCIRARPSKIFVGADYSQLEPRVFAYISKDEKLLQTFKGGDDFYSVIGIETFNKTDCTASKEEKETSFRVKYKDLRFISKEIALASVYGATGFQLMSKTGKSSDETQGIIDRYLNKFSNVKKMMLDSHEQVKANGMVTSVFGRPRRMPEAKTIDKKIPHKDLPYEARKLLNLSVNHRIQSTAASIVNRAMIRLNNNFKMLGINAKIVLQVHDSIVVECNEADADDVAVILQDSMENTTQFETVALEAIPKIGKTLANV